MQEARAAGCRTSAEADRYMELKRRREAEEASHRARESAQVGPSSQAGSNIFMASERPLGQPSSHLNDLDIMGFDEVTLLSEAVSTIHALLLFLPSCILLLFI